ncbi:uncharacterized protein N7484_008704 [Penicillium longicatenatum]|uniref:uncharacterized protein n=1 Tax=Penicillium longicatenatum TaxID=1561947 RepID=UPI0025466230|nr:uncharacterized protein N7484_008704 [Penicillium longicatenatum]KAJ5635391.1 hypothetical protein N7484_008704 [Penicillium longicatenatum]
MTPHATIFRSSGQTPVVPTRAGTGSPPAQMSQNEPDLANHRVDIVWKDPPTSDGVGAAYGPWLGETLG